MSTGRLNGADTRSLSPITQVSPSVSQRNPSARNSLPDLRARLGFGVRRRPACAAGSYYGLMKGLYWKAAVIAAAISYVGICILARLTYRRLLYPAAQTPAPPLTGAGVLRTVRARDGVAVHVLDFETPGAAWTVVHFHGNGETAGDGVDIAEQLAAMGMAVRLVEYRGYGVSAGPQPTEAGLYADAAAALDDLAARGVGPERVVLWGRSLGTGVAAEMARRGRGARLVLVAPYGSIPRIARRLAPGLPVSLLIGDRFDTLAKAKEIRVPTVVVHGTSDQVIPFIEGEAVAGAIPSARLIAIPGADHNDWLLVAGPQVLEDIVRALDLAPTQR
jgi:uncharacterized protein